jgi:hypothetical protein
VLSGIMGMDWRLRVCWLLVLCQVFVRLMYFGRGGSRVSHHMEVLRVYEWKMWVLWMSDLGEIRIRSSFFFLLNYANSVTIRSQSSTHSFTVTTSHDVLLNLPLAHIYEAKRRYDQLAVFSVLALYTTSVRIL